MERTTREESPRPGRGRWAGYPRYARIVPRSATATGPRPFDPPGPHRPVQHRGRPHASPTDCAPRRSLRSRLRCSPLARRRLTALALLGHVRRRAPFLL